MGIIQFKEANCKNCYKCIRSCPVKAISFKDDQATIVDEDCILCGNCLPVCPQNAKSVASDIEKVKKLIKKGEKVYASLAPSYAASFSPAVVGRMMEVFSGLGFAGVEETAVGAALVSAEYAKLATQGKMPNIITTACPSISFLVQKYYPELIHFLAPVVSPMIAHAKAMRANYGAGVKIVFVGPCVSKKAECFDLQNENAVDAVITFDEMGKWLEESWLVPTKTRESMQDADNADNMVARLYPVPGGIIKSVGIIKDTRYEHVAIDGMERCMDALDHLRDDGITGYFLEMNSCAGSCIAGPCMNPAEGGYLKARSRVLRHSNSGTVNPCSYQAKVKIDDIDLFKKFFERSRKYDIPSEQVIRSILSNIGKDTPEKDLNCGGCGYSTCRNKAIAVHNNRAEIYMCMPYMRERAESISNIIINNSPNAIFAMDMDLRIQEYNESARRIFGLSGKDMRGQHIQHVLDCPVFRDVLDSRVDIFNAKYHYENHSIIVEQSIVYAGKHNLIIAIIKNITDDEQSRQRLYNMRSEAVDMTQKVIEKQMRVAQEIASLLGETTAETKVTLTKLKKSITSETDGWK